MGRDIEGYYIRTPKWHFVFNLTDDTKELYDMEKDPMNEHNMIEFFPDQEKEFTKMVWKWKKEMESQ